MKESIRKGLEMFQTLADKYQNSINDLGVADNFFAEFMQMTGGAVIIDFLDADNWDYIYQYEVDKARGLLKLFFRLPCKDPEEKKMRQMVFPFDYYALVVKFRNVRFLRDKNGRCAGFVVNGYTLKDKEVKRYVMSDGWTEKGYDNVSSFFSSAYVREQGGLYEHARVMTTPITSFWIFPKMLMLSANDSEQLLYSYNIDGLESILSRSDKKLTEIINQHLPKDEEDEEIKNEGNRVRRVAEALFKLILCFYQDRCRLVQKNYNDRLLGDVTSPLKKHVYKDADDETKIGEITRIANDLSHDTGNPVNYADLMLLSLNIKYYIEDFKSKIEARDNLKVVDEPDALPSPKDFILSNYRNFDFSQEIKDIVKSTNGVISYRIRIETDPLNQTWFKTEHDWLCKDGSVKRLSEEDESEALVVWSREEAMLLKAAVHQKVLGMCEQQGLDTELTDFYFSQFPELHREGKSSHLFTEGEIRTLMQQADDSKVNKLVIDEEGYAHIIQNVSDGMFYPVSQESWGANLGYVGNKSSLSDLHDSYVLSLHSWLRYLQTGQRVYDDLWVSDVGLEDVIKEISVYY